jgi:hypothetical protein
LFDGNSKLCHRRGGFYKPRSHRGQEAFLQLKIVKNPEETKIHWRDSEFSFHVHFGFELGVKLASTLLQSQENKGQVRGQGGHNARTGSVQPVQHDGVGTSTVGAGAERVRKKVTRIFLAGLRD